MPQTHLDKRAAVENILRLHRAMHVSDAQTRGELERVLAHFEDLIGSTVRRADAARLLDISHTALDRWVEKGDIPAVLTPEGRREIPLPQLIDLLEQLEGRRDEGKLALAAIIRERRREAEAISEQDFLPPKRGRPKTHRYPELRALAYHRLVARRLNASVVDEARRRLRRWRESGRIHPAWADEWERVLAMPMPEIARLLASSTQRARELRQTSPFAGALTEHERRRVLSAVEERLAG